MQRSADSQLIGERPQSAGPLLPLTIENPPLADHVITGGYPQQSSDQRSMDSNVSSAEGGFSEEGFEFESSESGALIADLVELQLNVWGRKVAALQENGGKNKMAADQVKNRSKMADLKHAAGARGKPSSALKEVDYFTELKTNTGPGIKSYFRNLTPEDNANGSQPIYFLNLTPDGYKTNVESRPESSFEHTASEEEADNLEAYLERLGKTG
jgi:hypothetical protein